MQFRKDRRLRKKLLFLASTVGLLAVAVSIHVATERALSVAPVTAATWTYTSAAPIKLFDVFSRTGTLTHSVTSIGKDAFHGCPV